LEALRNLQQAPVPTHEENSMKLLDLICNTCGAPKFQGCNCP
jgi:hypothetical protein